MADANRRALTDPAAGGALRRRLGWVGLTFSGVGLILGAGIYSILGSAAGVAGDALWLSFLVGSLAALLTGLSYAELATMFPQAGAEYVYARAAWPMLPWLPGTLGWGLAGAGVASAATVAEAFAGYASRIIALPGWALAAGLIAAVVAVNMRGIVEASGANVLFTLVEAGGLIALIGVGLRDPDLGRVLTARPHSGVFAGAALIFFAYLGFEDLANLAEEAKEPARDLPRAILLAVLATTLLYGLVAIAAAALLEPTRLAQSAAPLADAMRAGAPGLAGALEGVALFATANTALLTITATSRLLFGMARDGAAPQILSHTLARRRTPAFAILAAGAGAFAFLLIGGDALVGSVASALALLAFAVVNAAVIRLRRTQPQAARPFRVPGRLGPIPVFAVLALGVVGMLVTQFPPRTYAIAAAVLVGAFALQAAPWKRAARRRRS